MLDDVGVLYSKSMTVLISFNLNITIVHATVWNTSDDHSCIKLDLYSCRIKKVFSFVKEFGRFIIKIWHEWRVGVSIRLVYYVGAFFTRKVHTPNYHIFLYIHVCNFCILRDSLFISGVLMSFSSFYL